LDRFGKGLRITQKLIENQISGEPIEDSPEEKLFKEIFPFLLPLKGSV